MSFKCEHGCNTPYSPGSVDCIQLVLLYPVCKGESWSEYKDSNLGPSGPKPDALPGCATLRLNWCLRRESNSHPNVRSVVSYPLNDRDELNLRAYATFIVDLFRTYRPPSLTSSTMDITWAPSSVVPVTDTTLPSGWELNPFAFYCFGPSKKPRQRDFTC